MTWPDGHKSSFSPSWLEERILDERLFDERRSKRIGRTRDTIMWNNEKAQKEVKRFKFNDVMEKPEVMLEWLLCEKKCLH